MQKDINEILSKSTEVNILLNSNMEDVVENTKDTSKICNDIKENIGLRHRQTRLARQFIDCQIHFPFNFSKVHLRFFTIDFESGNEAVQKGNSK